MQQIFYVGVVEDRDDPLYLGRCKVRVMGIHHESLDQIPTEDLPWAFPMTPITSASMNGIGQAPLGPVEGTWVIVFFKDGDEMQQPVMMGTLPGIPIGYATMEEREESAAAAIDKITTNSDEITPTYQSPITSNGFVDPNGKYPKTDFLEEPDTNRLARHQKIKYTVVQKKIDARKKDLLIGNSTTKWEQPKIPYFAQYPFNHVYESEAGHIVEIDDTPNSHRMNTHSASGTFTEVDVNGTQVNRIVGNGYQIIEKDGFVQIDGTCVVTINGDASVRVGGQAHLDVKESLHINVDADMNLKCKSLKIDCSDFNVKSAGRVDIKAGSMIAQDGSTVHMNSGYANPKAPTLTFNPTLVVLTTPTLEE
jgi:hypothetical protein